MTYIPIDKPGAPNIQDPATGLWHTERSQCPFGVRDLTSDECYSGSGRNRCPYFVRYDWEQHAGCIACNHPPVEQQREFDFGQ
ncbi:MAG: hypothetical protein II814_03490 [Treponema sp.]|nr:hypothetical protein [Treponema sp.]